MVIKKDGTEKRGSKVYYILSEQAKKKYQLKLLGIGYEFERRKSIYQLLLYYDVFKRSNPLTKMHLDRFLKKIGTSADSIKNLENTYEKVLYSFKIFLQNLPYQ